MNDSYSGAVSLYSLETQILFTRCYYLHTITVRTFRSFHCQQFFACNYRHHEFLKTLLGSDLLFLTRFERRTLCGDIRFSA